MKYEDKKTLSLYQEVKQINNHADVMLIRHIETQELFVKKILPAYSERIYRRIYEMRLLGVPEVFHIINDDENIIVIEEFINNETLANRLKREGTLSLEEAADIISALCDILKQFHDLTPQIIHRDIKPSNILIDAKSNVTLIDFDAAKTYDSEKGRDTVLMGTPDFAAPEQYGFMQSDARTDIYAIGVLFNVLLTGEIPSVKLHNGKYSKIIQKCTNIDRNKRYKSVRDLHMQLAKVNHKKVKSSEPVNSVKKFNNLVPPGFRTKKVWKMISAVFGYAFIVFASVVMEIDETKTMSEAVMYHIGGFLLLLSIVFWFFDWGKVASKMPISRHKNIAVSMIGRLLWLLITAIVLFAILACFVDNV